MESCKGAKTAQTNFQTPVKNVITVSATKQHEHVAGGHFDLGNRFLLLVENPGQQSAFTHENKFLGVLRCPRHMVMDMRCKILSRIVVPRAELNIVIVLAIE